MKANDELRLHGEPEPWARNMIVCMHPLGDQESLLQRLNMNAADCNACDIYWAYKGNLFFVSVFSSDKLGIDLRRNVNLEHPFSFTVRTSRCPLTTNDIDRTIDYLRNWVEAHTLEEACGTHCVATITLNDPLM
jgi:hypothetical protein